LPVRAKLICRLLQDLTLPKSIITRLAKGVLPPNTQIQANAILALSKSATVFINYLASQYSPPNPLFFVCAGGAHR
jgi:histone H3/H4